MGTRLTAVGRNTTVPGLRRNESVNVRDDHGTELGTIAEGAVDALVEEAANTGGKSNKSGTLAALLDTGDLMCDAADALIDDSFFRCFTSAPPDNWNFTWWLFPQWCLGVALRYCVLFPLRLALTLLGMLVFLTLFFLVQAVLSDTPRRRTAEREIVRWIACLWIAVAWNGVIKYHGPKPSPAPNRIWVANHSSMIDYTILTAFMPFANIMQLQGSWVGFLQKRVLSCLGCVWFQRGEAKDRNLVHTRMLAHVQDPATTPLLVFPEGTCVNNEYTVMFKKGAFDLGATVCPVAIKYNKIFVDAFWNSRRQAFSTYVFKLMTSWALVADVYFLPPQRIQEGEAAEQFAARVQRAIADTAKLRIVTWDGYLKYYSLAEKKPQLVEARRRAIAKRLLREVGEGAEQAKVNGASEDET